MLDVTYIATYGLYIAVGRQGTILRSSNGTTWSAVPLPSAVGAKTNINSVTFSPTLGQIAIGGNFGICTSVDQGLTWTLSYSLVSSSSSISEIVWANNRYVAVGGFTGTECLILTSTTGSTWTVGTPPAGVTDGLFAVTYGTPTGVVNGRWGAVGDNARFIYSDNNGATWTNVSTTAANGLYDVKWISGLNIYVVLGQVISTITPYAQTSANFTTWTTYSNPGGNNDALLYSVFYDGTKILLLGGDGKIVTSTNGTVWTNFEAPRAGDITLSAAAYNSGGPRYVTVGYGQDTVLDFTGALQTSIDMQRSSTTIIYAACNFWRSALKNGNYLAFGEAGIIFSSSNLVTWSGKYLPVDTSNRALIDDGTRLIIAGSSINFLTSTYFSYIYSSTDGINWTQNYTTSGSAVLEPMGGIFIPGGMAGTTHIIVGEGSSGNILVSSNGTAWSQFAAGAATGLQDIAYGEIGGLVGVAAIGKSNRISFRVTNPTGGTWTNNIVPGSFTGGSTARTLTGIVYSPNSPSPFNNGVVGTWTITGRPNTLTSPGTYLFTSDKTNFPFNTYVSATAPGTTFGLTSVTRSNTNSVQAISGANGYVATAASTDILTWTQRTTPGNASASELYNISSYALRMVAVGGLGTVLISYQ